MVTAGNREISFGNPYYYVISVEKGKFRCTLSGRRCTTFFNRRFLTMTPVTHTFCTVEMKMDRDGRMYARMAIADASQAQKVFASSQLATLLGHGLTVAHNLSTYETRSVKTRNTLPAALLTSSPSFWRPVIRKRQAAPPSPWRKKNYFGNSFSSASHSTEQRHSHSTGSTLRELNNLQLQIHFSRLKNDR